MQTKSSQENVPEWLVGLWRRESITLDDGTIDDTTIVYWAQTSREFVDIRVPANRPEISSAQALKELTSDELLALAGQKGFAGYSILEGNRCIWNREIDFRPSTGRPDTGMVRVEGDTLFEEGDPDSVLGSGYREVYRRECDGSRLCATLKREAGQRGADRRLLSAALLVLLNDRFMFARDRPKPLPPAETLHELVTRQLAEAPGSASSLLDCEVSLGQIDDDASALRVELSTIPMREQQSLFLDNRARVLSNDVVAVEIDGVESLWKILHSNASASALAALLSR